MSNSLFDEWQANKHRPAWVQMNAARLEDAADVDVPRSRSEIDAFLDAKMGVITRRLKPDHPADDPAPAASGGDGDGEDS